MHQFNIKSNIDTTCLELISIEGAVFKWVLKDYDCKKNPKVHIVQGTYRLLCQVDHQEGQGPVIYI